MNAVSTLGIDLAKNTFSVHGVDANGVVTVRRTVSRGKLAELVARLPPCLIGMEACSGAHEWARRFGAAGHTVRLMAAKFVAPYRKSGKNDGNDAEAICEAVGRPNMRFVPIKSVQQQSDLSLHRVRQGFVEERTATFNRIRGLIAEFGYVLPNGVEQLRQTGARGTRSTSERKSLPNDRGASARLTRGPERVSTRKRPIRVTQSVLHCSRRQSRRTRNQKKDLD